MDFDRVTDRRGTGSLKWDWNGKRREDVVPLWVADMDFPPPEEVTAALLLRAKHPVYGYTNVPGGYFELLKGWYASRHGALVGTETFRIGPGAVPSLAITVRTFSGPGEGVLVLPPVYYPFQEVIRENGRVLVEAPLERDGASGRMTFTRQALETAISEAAAKGVRTAMIMFCSPHNPGGAVWKPGELEPLLSFAREHGLIVVSDEIHGDLVFPPDSFVSLAGFPGAAERTVVVSAPNKTFNLAGLHISHFVVQDASLRARLGHGLAAAGFSQPNVFSITAAEAAYRSGGPWLDGLLAYLRENLEYAVRTVNESVRGVKAFMPEGTYLVWADASRLIGEKRLPGDRELVAALEAEAGVRVVSGSTFGTGGKGFLRINVACPRSILAEGLDRFANWASM